MQPFVSAGSSTRTFLVGDPSSFEAEVMLDERLPPLLLPLLSLLLDARCRFLGGSRLFGVPLLEE